MTMKKKSLVAKKGAKAKGNPTTKVDISKPTAVKVVSAKGIANACAPGQHIPAGTINC